VNVQEAKDELARPLVFGDPEQIAARNVLRQVADCAEVIYDCPEKHIHESFRKSRVLQEVCHCLCARYFEFDIKKAAVEQLLAEADEWAQRHNLVINVR
jgi:hypothetical protein